MSFLWSGFKNRTSFITTFKAAVSVAMGGVVHMYMCGVLL